MNSFMLTPHYPWGPPKEYRNGRWFSVTELARFLGVKAQTVLRIAARLGIEIGPRHFEKKEQKPRHPYRLLSRQEAMQIAEAHHASQGAKILKASA